MLNAPSGPFLASRYIYGHANSAATLTVPAGTWLSVTLLRVRKDRALIHAHVPTLSFFCRHDKHAPVVMVSREALEDDLDALSDRTCGISGPLIDIKPPT